MLSDTRSGTVLAADGELIYPQEHLDALSMLASDTLDVVSVHAIHAILHTPHATRLFVRVPHLGTVALTCIVNPGSDITELLPGLLQFAGTLEIGGIAA
ncbi:hypothetical protein [Gymnodinialimonas hymeniacidonis]|uniref:hypothetical protein n=1 Tax=Gymnodinialimonas hymeniacidonis TaxID=3126508 RepID=UPI0034C69222